MVQALGMDLPPSLLARSIGCAVRAGLLRAGVHRYRPAIALGERHALRDFSLRGALLDIIELVRLEGKP